MTEQPPASEEGPLALICGGGSLPLAVADYAAAHGREVVLFPLRGAAEGMAVERYRHHWIYVGQIGKLMRLARAAGCRDIVFIGSLVRPAFWHVRPDFAALTALPKVLAAFRGGDDHLLTSVARMIEENGFRLRGAHEVAPEILFPRMSLGAHSPSAAAYVDIAFGFDYLRVAGPFDIGQAVVVADKHILAVEAAEGTDAMLERVSQLRANGRLKTATGKGVLVKAAKPGQDRRFDLPSIGPHTVEGVARAGLDGIAVAAGENIVAEPEKLVRAADRAGIFVVGVAPASAP